MMITFLSESTRKLKNKNMKMWPLVYKINKAIVNICYPITQLFNDKYGIDDDHDIVVSLTSFPDRINSAWISISSLLNQTYKPKKVILWLAEEQFPSHSVPLNIQKLCGRGLEIRYCDDLRPHKKYYYTMKLYPNEYIVTADDDILYPENHLENLINAANRKSNCVVCSWSHTIALDNNEFLPYKFWANKCEEEPSMLTIPIGCNGVLYPPHCLSGEVFNIEQVKKYIYTDDLWLKCMEVKNGVPAWNYVKTPLIYFNVVSSQFSGLWKSNTMNENRNDQVWRQLMNEYSEVKEQLVETYCTQRKAKND